MTFTPKEAWDFICGLSAPSKMPCYSYSISAFDCQTGRKLAKILNSVCNKCYAVRGNYLFRCVKNAHANRLASITKPEWVDAIVTAIGNYESSGFFRWFDSGDLQSLAMLEKICQVAKRLPHIQFWLPTKEYKYVAAYVKKHGEFPSNLTVRLSAYMLEQTVPTHLMDKLGVVSSMVTKGQNFSCPSHKQNNKCLDCRLCWDKNQKIVSYHYH
jgi:hypothetical protein